MFPGGIQTRNPNNQAAADTYLQRRGHQIGELLFLRPHMR